MRQKSRKRKKLADEEDSEEEEDPSTFSVKTTLRDVCENEQTLAAIDFIARRWATPFHYLAFEALRVFVAVLTAPPDECDGDVHQLLEREIEAVAGEGGTDAAARQRAIGLPDMGRSTWWSWLLSALTVSDSRYSRPGSGSELLRVVLGRFLFSDATGRARPGVPRLEQTGMDSVGRQMLVTVRTNLEQHMRNNFAAWLFRLCSAVVSEAAAGRQVAFGAAAVTAQAPPQEPQPCLNNDALGDPDDEWWADASAADGHSDEEDPGSNGLSRKVLDSLSRRLYAALRSDQPLVLQPQDLSAPVAVVQHMQHFLTGGRHLLRQRGLYDDAVDDARWRLSSALREHPLQYLSTAADILRALGPLHQARLQARIAACEASRQLQQQLQSAPTEDRRQQLQQQVTAAKQRVKSSKRALDDVQLFSVVPEPRMGVVHFQLTYTTAMTIAANLDVLAAARQSEASSSRGSAATVCWPRLQTVSNAQRYRRIMASQQQQARRAQISELEAELRFQRRWVKCLAGRQRKARQVLRNLAQQQMPLAPQQQLHVYHLQQQLAREQRCLQKAKGNIMTGSMAARSPQQTYMILPPSASPSHPTPSPHRIPGRTAWSALRGEGQAGVLRSGRCFIFFMATSAIAPELEVAFIKTARAVDPKFPIAMPNGYDEAAKAGLEVTAANGSKSYPLVDGIYYVNDVIYPKANDRYKSMFGITYMPTLDAGAQSNSYDAMSAIIRAAQAAGYSNLTNINKALSSKTFTFPRYGGNTGRFDVNGDIMADAQLQTYSPVTGEAVPLDVMP